MVPDEDESNGAYGPYVQSQRAVIYLTYARELLRNGRAYPCFATRAELAEIADRQRAASCTARLLRPVGDFLARRPGRAGRRTAGRRRPLRGQVPLPRGHQLAPGSSFTDAIQGDLVQDDNRNDAVILKSSDQHPRLPTYHFAHAVDDHLMRVSLVIRGEEWLSSVPLRTSSYSTRSASTASPMRTWPC